MNIQKEKTKFQIVFNLYESSFYLTARSERF